MTDLYGMVDSDDIVKWITDKGVTPLYLAVSGSHASGLNRPDSDLDVRCIYLDPTEKVLSLHPGKDNIEGMGLLGGCVDFQGWELGKALRMLDNYNGNIIHLLLAPTCFYDTRTVDWKGLASKFITKRLTNYFIGYYHSQKKRAAVNRGGKSLLYTYREGLTGIMLLRTGEWIFDFHELKHRFEEAYNWHSVLLDGYMNRHDWMTPVDMDKLSLFEFEWEYLIALLKEEEAASVLPETYDGYDELNSILLQHRLECAKIA